MEKIEIHLAELIKKEPQTAHKIILVLKEADSINELSLKMHTVLMSNIISATLTGEEIVRLSKNNAVVSIEPDTEMGIL